MQLHVLGPAFGLPSIDAECNAATTLLQLYALKGWTVIATHDLDRRLPALKDGDELIEGFKSIAKYIETHEQTQQTTTNTKNQADSIAICAFIQSHAQLLLDISLYVSYENYAITRSSFTKILPWYANYIIPPRRRSDARLRTGHLGISSIDINDVHEDLTNRHSTFDVGKEQKFEAEAKQRASLLLSKANTVRSLLSRPEHSAVFKLHALADNFFGPLEDMLGDNSYFLGTEGPQKLDCLVYGYLSLMLNPVLPQDWLATTMRRKYTKLVRFTERIHAKLQMQTDVNEVMSLSKLKSQEAVLEFRTSRNLTLPWDVPPISKGTDVAAAVTSYLISRVPLIGPSTTVLVSRTEQKPRFWQNRYFPALFAATTASIGLGAYYAFATGLLVWPHGEPVHIFGKRRLADYGHLGAALAGFSFLGQQATNDVAFYPQNATDNPVSVEVEVETDAVP